MKERTDDQKKTLGDWLAAKETVFEGKQPFDPGKRKKKERDARYINFKLGEKGIGNATIRFLPCGGLKAKEFGDVDHILVQKYHWYQEDTTGKYLVEMCPNTTGNKCPICAAISPLFKSTNENDIAIRNRKKSKIRYIANIYIEEYPLEPEYEGKVYLWEIPGSIYKEILNHYPESADQVGKKIDGMLKFYPFHPFVSAPLNLFYKEATAPLKGKDYTGSTFETRILPMEKEIFEKVYPLCYDLREISKEEKFQIKSYQELEQVYQDSLKPEDFKDVGKKESKKQETFEDDVDIDKEIQAAIDDDTPPLEEDNDEVEEDDGKDFDIEEKHKKELDDLFED